MKNIKKLLNKFIKKNYIEPLSEFDLNKKINCELEISYESLGSSYKQSSIKYKNIDNFINLNKDNQTFSQFLFQLIDETGLKDSEIYNRVNMDRRLFSKIRSNLNYQPSKYTVFSLIIALQLDYSNANKLLNKAGYNFSKNYLADIIIMFCIENNIYDVFLVNELLVDHNQKALCLE